MNNFLKCHFKGHEDQDIIKICIHSNCQYKHTVCNLCQNELHTDHASELKELNYLDQQISQIEFTYQQLQIVLQRLQYEIQEAINGINHKFTLIMGPIENYKKQKNYQTLTDISTLIYNLGSYNYSNSVKIFEKILTDIYVLNGQVKLKEKQEEQVQQQQSQQQQQQLLDLGCDMLKNEQWNEAIQKFDQILINDTMNVQAIFYKAEALRSINKYDQAINEYQRCQKFDKQEKVEYYFGIGECLRSMNRYQEAIESFDKSLKIDKKHFQSLLGKADCLRMLNQLIDSLNYYNIALQIKPKDFYCLKFAGVIMEEIGNENFIDYYKEAANLDRTDEYLQSKLQILRSTY